MKSRPVEKKQTLKLKVEENIHNKLIGISSHENDYRLVWSINNQLNIQFVRIDNLIIHNQKFKTDLEFSRFTFNDENRYLKYELISNRCPDGFLFPEIKNFDFLVQITGAVKDDELKELVKKLKAVEIISAVFVLQTAKLKRISQILPG